MVNINIDWQGDMLQLKNVDNIARQARKIRERFLELKSMSH